MDSVQPPAHRRPAGCFRITEHIDRTIAPFYPVGAMRPVPDHIVGGVRCEAVALLALTQRQFRGHLIVDIFQRSIPAGDLSLTVAPRIGASPAPSVADRKSPRLNSSH